MKFISRKTKFSTVTKKERIEQVNVKSEDEANKVLGDYLLGKGITIKTLTRVLFLMITSLISVFLVILSTTTFRSLEVPQFSPKFILISILFLIILTLVFTWYFLVRFINVNKFRGFKLLRTRNLLQNGIIVKVTTFEQAFEPNKERGLLETAMDSISIGLPALVPGTTTYMIRSIEFKDVFGILTATLLSLLVVVLIATSIKREIAKDTESRRKELTRIRQEIKLAYEKLETEPEAFIDIERGF